MAKPITQALIDLLPRHEAYVVIMRGYIRDDKRAEHGLPFSVIAAYLGETTGAVSQRYYRAVRRLKGIMEVQDER